MKTFTKDEMKALIKHPTSGSSIAKVLRENPEFKAYCAEQVKLSDGMFRNETEFIIFTVLDMKEKHCPICGKRMTYHQMKTSRTCSIRCSRLDEPFLNRKKCDEAAKAEKFRKTCLERYGAVSPLCKGTTARKKADEHWRNLGVENPGQLDEVKEKIKKTNLERYGNEKYLKSDDFYKRKKETIISKVDMSSKMNEMLAEKLMHVDDADLKASADEVNKAVRNHQSFLNLQRYADYATPLFDESEWEGLTNGKVYKWKCARCGREFDYYFHSLNPINGVKIGPRCPNCFPKMNGFSYGELELLDFCKSMFPSAHKDRSLIKPYELDVVIDELKTALEFNGLFYHCVQCKPAGYHLMKTTLCNEKGFRLLHVWEDDWTDRRDETKRRIEEALRGGGLSFSEDELSLPLEWYNGVDVQGYELVDVVPPATVERSGFMVEDCGYVRLRKLK